MQSIEILYDKEKELAFIKSSEVLGKVFPIWARALEPLTQMDLNDQGVRMNVVINILEALKEMTPVEEIVAQDADIQLLYVEFYFTQAGGENA